MAPSLRHLALFLALCQGLGVAQGFGLPRGSPGRRMASVRSGVSMVSLPTPTKPKKDGGATVIEKESVKERNPMAVGDEASRNDGMYSVLLFNDEVNTREYVARCLVVVCGLAEGDAFSVMQKAHADGYAVVGQWGAEVAEMYCSSLQQKGLYADMTEA